MDWREIGKRLIFPPVWLMLILVVVSTAGLIYVFVKGLSGAMIAYPVYVVSFYTVSVITVFLAVVLPKRYKEIKQKIYANPIGYRYMTDAVFRTHISLYLSLAINLMFAAANVAFSAIYNTAWFAIFAGYYAILAVMRFILLKFMRKNSIGSELILEFKRSRVCAFVLLLLNLSLSAAVLMILYQDKGFEYHGILIYVMALYTFYTTAHAIINVLRYRKYHSPVMSASKVIDLSGALVSMLALETAMFTQFGGDMAVSDMNLMVMLTGAGISVAVITMSVYMIVRANRKIKNLR